MTDKQKELYTQTKERLRRLGKENPAECIVALAEEIEELRLINRLHEQDVEDWRKLAESKVEEIHPEFMHDYKCLQEELDGTYEELADLRADLDELQGEKDALRRELKRLPEMILRECRACLDFAKNDWDQMHVLTAIEAVERAVHAVETHRE